MALLIGMVVSTFFNFDGSDIFVCLYYVAENIRDTKRFYPILGRDVHSGYESTCFLSEEDYKKREIGDTITMTRFIWK